MITIFRLIFIAHTVKEKSLHKTADIEKQNVYEKIENRNYWRTE